jgi:hypothetical protein
MSNKLKALKDSDTLIVIFSFVDPIELIQCVALANKSFFQFAMKSVEIMRFTNKWNQLMCNRMYNMIDTHCQMSLKHCWIKNTHFPGVRFLFQKYPKLESFECLDLLSDKSEIHLLVQAVLIHDNKDTNPHLKKLYFNLDNIRTHMITESILKPVEEKKDQFRCRNIEHITFANSFADPVKFATLLFHIMTGSQKYMNYKTKSLNLRHFSDMDIMLLHLEELVRKAGMHIRLESIHFFSCKNLTDRGLGTLYNIFDSDTLRSLKLELIDGKISVRDGWTSILSHFHYLTEFKCDSFILNSHSLSENQAYVANCFQTLSYGQHLEVLCLNFYKFREDMRKENNVFMHLFGKMLLQELLKLNNLRHLELLDLGEMLTQEKFEQALDQAAIETSAAFSNIRVMKICNAKIRYLDTLFKLIHQNVEFLCIEYCSDMEILVLDADKAPQFPNLKSLDLTRMRLLSGNTLEFIAGHMKQLQVLNLTKCVSLQDFMHLSKLTSLKKLHLNGVDSFGDRHLCYLSSLTELEELSLVSLENFSGEGFKDLLKSSTNESDWLCCLPKLRILKLDWCEALSDQALEYLQYFTGIRYFSLIHSENLKGFQYLGKLISLEYLSLNRVPNITDDTLTAIVSNARNLTHLFVNAGYKKLNYNLSNQCLKPIGNLRQLRELELNFCGQIDNSCLDYLVPLKYTLVSCNFLRCPKLTKKAIEGKLPYTFVYKEFDRHFQSKIWNYVIGGVLVCIAAITFWYISNRFLGLLRV